MIVGRTLMLLGCALGAIAEGLEFVAEICADASVDGAPEVGSS